MSLLSHLLQYSSLSQSKQQRSNSATNRFLYSDTYLQNCRKSLSKSLNKLNLNSGQKIDPKQKMLHKIFHTLNMKFKKHYYKFFVILQTMKNKNISFFLSAQRNKSKLSNLNQIIDIISLKIYQRSLKAQSFNKILSVSKQYEQIKKFLQKTQKIANSILCKLFFKNLKIKDKYTMKIDILTSALYNIAQSIDSQNYLKIKDSFDKLKNCNLQCKNNIIELIEIKPNPKELTKINNQIICQKIQTQQQTSKYNSSQSFLKNYKQKIKQHHDSPVKNANKIDPIGIPIKVSQHQHLSNIWKSKPILTNFDEQPFHFEIQIQIKPKQCSKLHINNIIEQIGDLHDQNNLFIEFREMASYRSLISCNSQISKGTLVDELQVYRDNSKCNSMLIYQNFSNTESVSSFTSPYMNKNNHIFGNEAVSFKNSLVNDREQQNYGVFTKNMNIVPNQKKISKEFKKSSCKQYISSTRKTNDLERVPNSTIKTFQNFPQQKFKQHIVLNVSDKNRTRKTHSFTNKADVYIGPQGTTAEINRWEKGENILEVNHNSNNSNAWSGIKISGFKVIQNSQRAFRSKVDQNDCHRFLKRESCEWNSGELIKTSKK